MPDRDSSQYGPPVQYVPNDTDIGPLKAEMNVPDKEENPYDAVKRLLKQAVEALDLPMGVYEILKKPRRFMTVSIPVRMDDGTVKNFTGFRSQHSDILGPTKGGVRFHPNVYADEVTALSIWMSLKSAILGLPYGGAKGGVIVNPGKLSERELEELSRGYIRELEAIIGPEKDIPAPDVNTNPQIMGWMLDEFDRLRGQNMPGFITGKPLILGGSLGRLEATGRGVVINILEAIRRLGLQASDLTAAIQGFGNVGSMTARFLAEHHIRVIAVNDALGGVYCEDGLDIPALIAYSREMGTVAGFPGARPLEGRQLFEVPADIFVPAAMENQITEETAPLLRAKIVAEAANGPTTAEGDRIMHEKGVFVIPDILCNAGGVTVSYFEWVQNAMHYYWSEEEVNEKLQAKMRQAFETVYQMHLKHQVDMRTAAYMVGVSRLAEALFARGWLKGEGRHHMWMMH
ncbi:MAG: Glu/Leu/Phe/Val dehydrogenase [Bacillota bacterium]